MDFEKILDKERRIAVRDNKAYRYTEQYADRIGEDSPVRADAREILAQGGSLAPYCVLIPVAAHQEAHSIYQALEQYAQQVTDTPFTIVLNLNSPTGSDKVAINNTLVELERARADFPALDIRSIGPLSYFDPTIGEVRGNLWDSCLVAGIEGGTISAEQDMIGINHDIDLVRLPRSYIQTIQNDFDRRQKRSQKISSTIGAPENVAVIDNPRFTNVKHAYDARYPNISLAAFWEDYLLKTSQLSYEAGAVIPFSWYAKHGGIDPLDRMSEVLNLLDRGRNDARTIQSSALETSPRRHIERLQDHDLSQIWGEGTFHPTESYRHPHPDVADISQDRMYALVKDKARADLIYAIERAAALHLERRSLDDDMWDATFITALEDPSNPDNSPIVTAAFEKIESEREIGRQKAISIARFVLKRVIRHPLSDQILLMTEQSLQPVDA